MDSPSDPIIQGVPPSGAGVQLHHRDFGEVRAQGEDAADAATQLSNQLTKALDSALTTWRREAIEKAIADVNAFRDSRG